MTIRQHAPSRLVAGGHLYRGHDGAWRVADPTGQFFRLRSGSPLLSELQPLLHGHAQSCPTLDAARTARAIDALDRQGFVAQPKDPPDLRMFTVLVEGDTPVGDQVVPLLDRHVTVERGPLETAGNVRPDLVISCAGWLPDSRWRSTDELLRSEGAPWHRCYAEGRRWVIGPIAIQGRTATYRDTRSRILAAAGQADELAGHWSYLDAGACLPPVPELAPGASAIVAGLMVADVLAVLAGQSVPSEGCQLVFDPLTSEVTRHPVLPLPPVWSSQTAYVAPATSRL